MTNLEIARNLFTAYNKAMIEHLFRNAPAPVEADFGYKHGWVQVNGESFSHEACFGPPTTLWSCAMKVASHVEWADGEIERLRAALEWMRDRDNRNGSLPGAYREMIDATLEGRKAMID